MFVCYSETCHICVLQCLVVANTQPGIATVAAAIVLGEDSCLLIGRLKDRDSDRDILIGRSRNRDGERDRNGERDKDSDRARARDIDRDRDRDRATTDYTQLFHLVAPTNTLGAHRARP